MNQNPLAQTFLEFHGKPLKEKSDKRYGKMLAEKLVGSIKQDNQNYFVLRNSKIEMSRKFAMGKQPMDEFLDLLGIDGKNSYVNLDMRSPSIAPKYINRLVQRFMERDERPIVTAIDQGSNEARRRQILDAEFRMKMGGQIQELSQTGGFNLEDPDAFVPEDEDDLKLWEDTEQKLDVEIKFQKGIYNVLQDSDIQVIKKRLIGDIVKAGFACAEVYLDAQKNIKVRFCMPEHVVHTFFRYEDARDCSMIGEMMKMKVSDVRAMFPEIDEMVIFDMAQKSNQNPYISLSWTEDYRLWLYRPYDDVTIDVFKFKIKTTETEVSLKKINKAGRLIVEEKREEPKYLGENKEVIKKNIEVVYSGCYCISTKEMLEWKLEENMIKPHQALHEVMLGYVMVMPDNEEMESLSMVERMIPSIRKMTVIELKIQQIVAKLKPDGIAINPKRLMDVNLGEGKKTAIEVTSIWEQTGVLYYDDQDEDGNIVKGTPIQPLDFQGSIMKLRELRDMFMFYEQRLMSDIGSNESVDGIGVDDRKGLGVMQNQINSSNRATEYIYDAWSVLLNNICKRISVLLWYNVMSGSNKYTNLEKSEVVDMIPDLKITMLPTTEERMYVEQITNQALAAQSITFEEAFKIRRLAKEDVKCAERYLAKYQKKRENQKMAEAQNAAQANAQQQMASNQQAHQNAMQVEQLKGEYKSNFQKLVNDGDINKQIGSFVQEIVKQSFVTGKEIPGYITPIVEMYFQNLASSQQLQVTDSQQKMQQIVQAQQQAMMEQQAQQEQQGKEQPQTEGEVVNQQ